MVGPLRSMSASSAFLRPNNTAMTAVPSKVSRSERTRLETTLHSASVSKVTKLARIKREEGRCSRRSWRSCTSTITHPDPPKPGFPAEYSSTNSTSTNPLRGSALIHNRRKWGLPTVLYAVRALHIANITLGVSKEEQYILLVRLLKHDQKAAYNNTLA